MLKKRKLKDIINLSRFTLDETIEITDCHSSEGWAEIKEGYRSDNILEKYTAIFLGCLLSSNRVYVFLSRREMSKLLENTPNLTPVRKSISKREFDRLKAYLVNSEIVLVHKDSSSFASGERRAARVELILEPYRSEIEAALGPDNLKIHQNAFQSALDEGKGPEETEDEDE